MAGNYTHHKAFRCRIENTGRIKRIDGNWHVQINTSDSLQKTIDKILKKPKGENIVIKSEKGGGSGISNGEINEPYVFDIGGRPIKNTTKWLRLIKSDRTVWTITDNHYVGEQIQ